MKTFDFILYVIGCVLTTAAFAISIYESCWKKNFQAGIWWILLALFCMINNAIMRGKI